MKGCEQWLSVADVGLASGAVGALDVVALAGALVVVAFVGTWSWAIACNIASVLIRLAVSSARRFLSSR